MLEGLEADRLVAAASGGISLGLSPSLADFPEPALLTYRGPQQKPWPWLTGPRWLLTPRRPIRLFQKFRISLQDASCNGG
jgi:hypothetical protein